MGAAFGWGVLAASSVLLGGLLALTFDLGARALGLLMGFGAGVLISAVAYELVEEAFNVAGGGGTVAAGMLAALSTSTPATPPSITPAALTANARTADR